MTADRPRIGISACLLGDPVRYDAGHKRDPFLVVTFGPHVEWIKVCPEVEAGFGTPRDPMRLIKEVGDRRLEVGDRRLEVGGLRAEDRGIRLVVIKTGEDVTATLRDYSLARVEALAAENLSGYVLKKDSPSCGMERVKVYRGGVGVGERTGRGLFAAALLTRLPNLPVEEEGRLSDPRLRENFIERVFAYRRLRALFGRRWTTRDLVAFHTAHKLTLMAHSPAAYARLGRLVAGAATHSRAALAAEYESQFMQALSKIATPARHANVLQHMLGYFKKSLDADARAELLSVVEDHRLGRVPLIVPMTLMRHHVRRQGVGYLAGQSYLDPHPRELSLRNHV